MTEKHARILKTDAAQRYTLGVVYEPDVEDTDGDWASAEVIERRLQDARSDMSHWEEFDYIIINDDLDQAVTELEAVLAGNGEASSRHNAALRQAVSRIIE